MAKILIVDDSDVLRLELCGILTSGGHEVVQAINGADGAQQAVANTDLELIITDLNMPELDGISMCKRIREHPALKTKPIFMLTTESSADLKAAGKEAGVMLWIVKPFNGEKVLGAITKVLAMAKAAA